MGKPWKVYSTFHIYSPPLGFGGGMAKACPTESGGGEFLQAPVYINILYLFTYTYACFAASAASPAPTHPPIKEFTTIVCMSFCWTARHVFQFNTKTFNKETSLLVSSAGEQHWKRAWDIFETFLETNQSSLVVAYPSDNISQKWHVLCENCICHANTTKYYIM